MAENRNPLVKPQVLHNDIFRNLVEGNENNQQGDSKYRKSGLFCHDAFRESSAKVSFGSPFL